MLELRLIPNAISLHTVMFWFATIGFGLTTIVVVATTGAQPPIAGIVYVTVWLPVVLLLGKITPEKGSIDKPEVPL